MGKLIAMMTIRAIVDGKRVEFEEGDEVTGLAPHDVRALKGSGALIDESEQAALARRSTQEERKARAQFEAERQSFIEARESTEVPPAEDAQPPEK